MPILGPPDPPCIVSPTFDCTLCQREKGREGMTSLSARHDEIVADYERRLQDVSQQLMSATADRDRFEQEVIKLDGLLRHANGAPAGGASGTPKSEVVRNGRNGDPLVYKADPRGRNITRTPSFVLCAD